MLKRFFKLIGKYLAFAEDWYLCVALTIMGLLIVMDILSRAITGSSIYGAQEVATYLGIGVIAIGCASTSRVEDHIRVDIIYRLLHGRNLSLIKIIGQAFALMFCIVWFSWLLPFVTFAFEKGEASSYLNIPTFIVKGSLLVSAVLMIVYHAANVIRRVHNHITDKTYSDVR